MNLQHPIARVRGLGSAKSGTHHWWMQRVTAIALAALVPWFVVCVLGLVGADAVVVRAHLAVPYNAVLMLVFAFALFWHARLGLQVVIEDYIHVRWLEVALQLVVSFAFTLAAIASALAVGRIVFAG